jgi:hydrogenase expression/formation protein HypC
MCLAIPGVIESIKDEVAIVNHGGIKKEANISFVECKVGDYVLIHSGFAIEVVDKDKAEKFYKLVLEND